jgi:23S rRNA (guanosine2251-2'-O)-methyltransferase
MEPLSATESALSGIIPEIIRFFTLTHRKQQKMKRKNVQHRGSSQSSGLWLYGLHAVRAALANPQRVVKRAVLTERAAEELGSRLLARVRWEKADVEAVGRLLHPGSVHQGAALQCTPLPDGDLKQLLETSPAGRRLVVVLDQITDPHNVGAILRSAAAFGVAAIVVQSRHAPPESGVLAKAASGALDIVPYVSVVNIARTLEELGTAGFWRIALAGDGEQSLEEARGDGDMAIVLGSEGEGLRRLVRERCDVGAFIPIRKGMESLNVSNAAAVALYELSGDKRSPENVRPAPTSGKGNR